MLNKFKFGQENLFLFASEPKDVLDKLSALEYVEGFSLGCVKQGKTRGWEEALLAVFIVRTPTENFRSQDPIYGGNTNEDHINNNSLSQKGKNICE